MAKNKGVFAFLALSAYLLSYVALWGTHKDELFALTDHGCFKSVRERPALRHPFIENSRILQPVVTIVYYPVNALRLAQTDWHRE